MDASSIAILTTMILGFITVVFSVHGMIRSDMNRRFDEQKEDTNCKFEEVDHKFLEQKDEMNRRFDEQKDDMNRRLDEQKEEISEIKLGLNAMRGRLDIFIDNFALRVITEGRKPSRKSV